MGYEVAGVWCVMCDVWYSMSGLQIQISSLLSSLDTCSRLDSDVWLRLGGMGSSTNLGL